MKKLIIIIAASFLVGCSSADIAGFSALGQSHHIKQFSGGALIGEWDSTGKIENERSSDGYYFQDTKTQKLIMVSGTVQITVN